MENQNAAQPGPLAASLGSAVYEAGLGRKFHFNDLVVGEMFIGVPAEKRIGRLVQVRKGVGQFCSDVLFVRLHDETLITWENVLLRKADDSRFENAFYRSNGSEPPSYPPEEEFPLEEEGIEYTLAGGKFPETGFIVESPKQPNLRNNPSR